MHAREHLFLDLVLTYEKTCAASLLYGPWTEREEASRIEQVKRCNLELVAKPSERGDPGCLARQAKVQGTRTGLFVSCTDCDRPE